MPADPRLIVALDVPDALAGLALADRIGDACAFYKVGLGMLTGGGLALARELKDERGLRVFLDMKLWDIGATVEAAVRGLARFDLDLLTVQGDPQVVRAAVEGAGGSGLRILAVTVLTSLDRAEADLAKSSGPFYFGDRLTEQDVRLYTTIIRFDAVYVQHFKCNIRDIRSGYPNLHR